MTFDRPNHVYSFHTRDIKVSAAEERTQDSEETGYWFNHYVTADAH